MKGVKCVGSSSGHRPRVIVLTNTKKVLFACEVSDKKIFGDMKLVKTIIRHTPALVGGGHFRGQVEHRLPSNYLLDVTRSVSRRTF